MSSIFCAYTIAPCEQIPHMINRACRRQDSKKSKNVFFYIQNEMKGSITANSGEYSPSSAIRRETDHSTAKNSKVYKGKRGGTEVVPTEQGRHYMPQKRTTTPKNTNKNVFIQRCCQFVTLHRRRFTSSQTASPCGIVRRKPTRTQTSPTVFINNTLCRS